MSLSVKQLKEVHQYKQVNIKRHVFYIEMVFVKHYVYIY